MKTEKIYELIGELTKEIQKLGTDLRAKKEVVTQLLGAGASRKASDERSEQVPTPTANIVTSGEETSVPSSKERIDTGVRDSQRQQLYVNDRVRLDTNSTGLFFRNRQYRKGDIVVVTGPTRNRDIKVIDPRVPGIKHTVRKGANVKNLDCDY